MNFSESEIIAQLAIIFASPDPRVEVGIGDDAAVLAPTSTRWVVTTDMAVEGVHFRQDWSSAYEIGAKITAANLADIYAMGAKPRHLVAAISLTGSESLSWIMELATGMRDEAAKTGSTIVGGDLTRGPIITLALTALGTVENAILRSGAKVGDEIYISQLPGFSAAGLHLLSQDVLLATKLRQVKCAKRAIAQFRAPEVAYGEAIAFARAHSLCDVSDGLLTQATQMAEASGVNFLLRSDDLARHSDFSELAALAQEVGADIWDWVYGGGEDHIFLATGIDLPGWVIGEVRAGSGVEVAGVEKTPQGFRHFQ